MLRFLNITLKQSYGGVQILFLKTLESIFLIKLQAESTCAAVIFNKIAGLPCNLNKKDTPAQFFL